MSNSDFNLNSDLDPLGYSIDARTPDTVTGHDWFGIRGRDGHLVDQFRTLEEAKRGIRALVNSGELKRLLRAYIYAEVEILKEARKD